MLDNLCVTSMLLGQFKCLHLYDYVKNLYVSIYVIMLDKLFVSIYITTLYNFCVYFCYYVRQFMYQSILL